MDQTINLIGSLAALLTTASFVPQAIKTIRLKQTKDISLGMYIMFNAGVILWLIYGIALNSYPLIFANIVTLMLTLVILGYKAKYG